jgi:hypothetical protein
MTPASWRARQGLNLIDSRQRPTESGQRLPGRLIRNKPNVESKTRLRKPAVAGLKQNLRLMIVFQIEFREPHALAHR